MSRLMPVLFVLLTTTMGCTRRQQDFAWFAAAVAVEVAKASSESSRYESGPAEAAPATPEPVRGPSPEDLARAHDIAWELTKLAAHDARSGNCGAVSRTSDEVRVIDADVFTNVFLKDHEIQRCLAL